MRVLVPTSDYYPYQWGGTEVYVHSLTRELMERGHDITILASIPMSATEGQYSSRVRGKWYTYEKEKIFGVHVEFESKQESHRSRSDELDWFWNDWMGKHQFDIVHYHSLSPVASLSLMHAAKQHSLPVVFTYHTPTTCPMGTLMNWKGETCDGEVIKKRCLRCVIHQGSESKVLGMLAERVPMLVWQTGTSLVRNSNNKLGRLGTALQMPTLLELQQQGLREMIDRIDLWHVQSRQIYEVLRKNGVPDRRLYLLRHGLENPNLQKPSNGRRLPGSPLRLGYIGRLAQVKGIETLLSAFTQVPSDSPVELHIYAEPQDGVQKEYQKELLQLTQEDTRIHWKGGFKRESLVDTLSEIDVLVVPSEWVEIGPFTVHEAFAASVPVIGSDLGGIHELVTHEVDGLLFEMRNTLSLAAQIRRLIDEPSLLGHLQEGITPRQSMKDVALQIEKQYYKLVRR
ncbi:MAG: glycosyltransferase [Candidatus Neomarinimicrobiota bacterium]